MLVNPHKNKSLTVWMVLCALAVTAMCLSLALGNGQTQAEFIPPPFDANACIGTPEVSEKLGWNELDAQAFKVSVCGGIVPSDASADIWLTNPDSNSVWLKLRVLDMDGTILGETGLIKPGEYLQSVSLGSVPPSGTAIVLKIMAYEPETYYSAGAISINTTVS